MLSAPPRQLEACYITPVASRVRLPTVNSHPWWGPGGGYTKLLKKSVSWDSRKMNVVSWSIPRLSPRMHPWLLCSHYHQRTHHPLSLREPTGSFSCPPDGQGLVSLFACLARNVCKKPEPQAPSPRWDWGSFLFYYFSTHPMPDQKIQTLSFFLTGYYPFLVPTLRS